MHTTVTMLRQVARALIGGARRAADRLTLAALAVGERGQSVVEYALVLGLVAIVAMVAVQALGAGVGQVFTNILAKIAGVGK